MNHEMHALLAFKNSLHDFAMGCLGSWNNVSLSCCEWEGVPYDRQINHVVAVDFHNCSLSGAFFPTPLLESRDLKNLSVNTNNFTGQSIPQDLTLLKKLAYLNLFTVGIADNIPQQLNNFSKLRVLDLTSLALTPSTSMLKIHDLSWLTNPRALKAFYLYIIDLLVTSSLWGQSVSCISHHTNVTMSNYRLTSAIPLPYIVVHTSKS